MRGVDKDNQPRTTKDFQNLLGNSTRIYRCQTSEVRVTLEVFS